MSTHPSRNDVYWQVQMNSEENMCGSVTHAAPMTHQLTCWLWLVKIVSFSANQNRFPENSAKRLHHFDKNWGFFVGFFDILTNHNPARPIVPATVWNHVDIIWIDHTPYTCLEYFSIDLKNVSPPTIHNAVTSTLSRTRCPRIKDIPWQIDVTCTELLRIVRT